MQHLQDLREDVRVGRDSRTEDHRERVRALRRLRAALPRSAEMPSLDHSQAQGQHVHLHACAVEWIEITKATTKTRNSQKPRNARRTRRRQRPDMERPVKLARSSKHLESSIEGGRGA